VIPVRGVDVDQSGDAKSVVVETAVIGESHTEVSSADDDDIAAAIDAERADEMLLEPRNVVADAACAEFTEAGEVFSNLRRVEMEPLRKFRRGDGLLSVGFEIGEAAEIDRQATCRQLGYDIAIVGRMVLNHRPRVEMRAPPLPPSRTVEWGRGRSRRFR
jgi:hypothetical protein